MKCCTNHLHMIETELRKHDLWKFVSLTPETVVEKSRRWLEGKLRDKNDINPLCVVTMEILQRAATVLPSYVQSLKRSYCPLCEACKLKGANEDQKWIEGYTLATRKMMADLGVVKRIVH
jgi:hypothetical protein